MNRGTSSTNLPVRNPITRPVSFHSLPEHQNSPAYLSPYSHRRPRTPRSSPLAGPSVSSDHVDTENKDDEGNRKPRYRPNRISSTPDMVAPIQSIYDADTPSLSPSSSPSSTISIGTIGVLVPKPSVSTSSSEDGKEKESIKGREEAEDGNRLRSLAKRLSIVSTSSLATSEKERDDQKPNKRRASFILPSASTTSLASSSSIRTVRTDRSSHAAPPIPSIPRWALNAMREEAGANHRNMKYGHRRGTSDDHATSPPLPPLPNQPIPRGVRLSTSGLSNQLRPPSVSRDPSENWMSVTDPTPKFSRLGLGGEAVVMPVSKRESLAKMKSAGSIRSARSTVTASQPAVDARRDSAVSRKIESSSVMDSGDDSNAVDTETNLKEKEGLRKRSSSLASSLRAKIPKITVSSSAGNETVPPLPPPTSKSEPPSNSHTFPSIPSDPTQRRSVSSSSTITSPDPSRRSATLGRNNALAAIDENQQPPPLPSNDVKSRNTRARRKSIKQIVMRITTTPMSSTGEKMKLTRIRGEPPSMPGVVTLPSDALDALPPPAGTRFGGLASSSVQSLPFAKEVSEFGDGQGKACGKVRFRSIRKRWNTIFSTVRS